jgi:DNA-binding NarL/FixJ family response regulator
VILDRRVLTRECLAHALKAANADYDIVTFSSVTDWMQQKPRPPAASLIVLCASARKIRDQDVGRDLALIGQTADAPPIVLLADEDEPDQIIEALDSGVRGYIPMSVPLSVAVEAMHLVRAGGTYVPVSSLLSCRRTLESSAQAPSDTNGGVFTSRQTAVLKALREGKANKLIAYELSMRESTVKVHVRNIMKKLKARNRTEVAFKTSEIFAHEDRRRLERGG